MRKGLFKDFAILSGIALILLLGGYFLAKQIWNSDIDLSYKVSIKQEEKLGDTFQEMILHQYKAMDGNAADSAVQVIAQRLIQALDSTPYRFQITVLKSNEVNAFTIPGGNIFVFSGLIEFAESPEELAAVLSHEIGHAQHRHVVSRLVKEFSISILLSGLSGGDPALMAQLSEAIIRSSFDRVQEKDADQFGLELLEKAKVSPKNMAKFFDHLNKKDLAYDENLEILMSHPHNNSRIEQVRRYKTKNDFHPEPFKIDWERVQKSAKD